MRHRRGPPPVPRYLLVLVLVAPVLAGCMDDPTGANGDGRETPAPDGSDSTDGADGGDGTPSEPLWTNPYDFDLHFDGAAAYAVALQQLYEDPANTSGPRYRIPGTPTHAAVAEELRTLLDGPATTLGGSATFQRFDGTAYYDLDLSPVARYTSDSWCQDGARERVQDLTFSNIVARTDPDAVGYIIGAHWDSKRHATGSEAPILGGDDGAGASAAVIGLARAFAAADPGIPLTFVLFDGEDGFDREDCHPLAGSLYYAQSLTSAQRETVEGMILLDMVGNASANYHREGNSMGYQAPSGTVSSAWLVDHVWETAAAMQVEAFVDRRVSAVFDDHVPFLHEGLFAIDIIRFDGRFASYWHTTADDHTAIQPEGLEQVGVVVEASLRRGPIE